MLHYLCYSFDEALPLEHHVEHLLYVRRSVHQEQLDVYLAAVCAFLALDLFFAPVCRLHSREASELDETEPLPAMMVRRALLGEEEGAVQPGRRGREQSTCCETWVRGVTWMQGEDVPHDGLPALAL